MGSVQISSVGESATVEYQTGRSALRVFVDKPGPGRAGILSDSTESYKVVTGLTKIYPGETLSHTWFKDGVVIAGKRDFIDCIFGPPKGKTSSSACITGSNANGLWGSTFTDCLIDAENHSLWIAGIFLTNATLLRCEIRNAVDGFDFLYQCPEPTLSQQNWIHSGAYFSWVGAPGDGKTHNDGGQFHRGKNFTSRGDYIDGFQMQGLMIKQEVSELAIDKLENILIDRTWFGPSMKVGVNLFISRGNLLESVTINEPRFTPKSPAYYIFRPSLFAGKIINPVFEDGSAAPVSKGG